MRNNLLYLTIGLGLLLGACSKPNPELPKGDDAPIAISVKVRDFARNATETRAVETAPGSASEQQIDNLYLLLFEKTGTNPKRYYVSGATFSGGTWSTSEQKITLQLTQRQAGERQVYIIANVDNALKTKLDAVTSVTELTSTVYREIAKPWSPNIQSPILMSGSKSHNFKANYQLKFVELTRAVAKVELTIKLTSKFYSMDVNAIRYRLVDFDKRAYVIKPNTKPDNLVNSSSFSFPKITDWSKWGNSLNSTPTLDFGFGYKEVGSGIVTNLVELKVITYINERDSKGAKMELVLYPEDAGTLPPPEFGPEFYAIPLPDKIERNHWYKYDIEI